MSREGPTSQRRCSGCASAELGAELVLRDQPVIQNYRCESAAAARRIDRRDIQLVECRRCGLIFNHAFDRGALRYDERYQNTQCHSAAFTAHLEGLAERWTSRFALRRKSILEVGCGKGDFLRLFCRRAGARGFGFDTSFEGEPSELDPPLRFFSRYLTADSLPDERIDFVVCRHVVEHVPEIASFLGLLREISVRAGGVPVAIETPAWEWIVDHGAFWDVFYEHCNYFTGPALRRLAERAGFDVVDQQLVFGDQYQIIELVPRAAGRDGSRAAADPTPSLARFASGLAAARARVAERLAEAGASRGYAIWGAGAKGVALANTLVESPPRFLIDSNPAKQGGFVPGSGLPVVSPDDPRVATVPVVLVANPNYLGEIRAALAARSCAPQLIAV